MARKLQTKSPRTIKDFSASFKKRLFSYNKGDLRLNPKTPDRVVVAAVRKIATGFDKVDARKPLTRFKRREAAALLKGYFEARAGRFTREVRPTPQNRRFYAEVAGLSPRYKIFPIQVESEKAKVKIKGRGKNRRIEVREKNITYRVYNFDSKKLVAEKSRKAHYRDTVKKIDKSKSYRLVYGRGYLAKKENKDAAALEREFNRVFTQYENAPKFVTGISAAIFTDQKKPKNWRKLMRERGR